MKVFISWSGHKSKLFAKELHHWLPNVLQFVEPWVSSHDILTGEKWALKLSDELEHSNFGIFCITEESAPSDWLMFEAGSIAKLVGSGRVAPLLFGFDQKSLAGPLSQFQAERSDKEGIYALVRSINSQGERPISNERLKHAFDLNWPFLEKKFSEIGDTRSLKKPTKQSRIDIQEQLFFISQKLDLSMEKTALGIDQIQERLFALSERVDRSIVKSIIGFEEDADIIKLKYIREKLLSANQTLKENSESEKIIVEVHQTADAAIKAVRDLYVERELSEDAKIFSSVVRQEAKNLKERAELYKGLDP